MLTSGRRSCSPSMILVVLEVGVLPSLSKVDVEARYFSAPVHTAFHDRLRTSSSPTSFLL
jgi:hypothetical protein